MSISRRGFLGVIAGLFAASKVAPKAAEATPAEVAPIGGPPVHVMDNGNVIVIEGEAQLWASNERFAAYQRARNRKLAEWHRGLCEHLDRELWST